MPYFKIFKAKNAPKNGNFLVILFQKLPKKAFSNLFFQIFVWAQKTGENVVLIALGELIKHTKISNFFFENAPLPLWYCAGSQLDATNDI